MCPRHGHTTGKVDTRIQHENEPYEVAAVAGKTTTMSQDALTNTPMFTQSEPNVNFSIFV